MGRIPISQLRDALKDMMHTGTKLTHSNLKSALQGLPDGKGAGRDYYRDLVSKMARGGTPTGTVGAEKAKNFLKEFRQHIQRGEVQAGSKLVTLSVRGRSMGPSTIDRLRQAAAQPKADATQQLTQARLAQQRAQRVRAAQMERIREQIQAEAGAATGNQRSAAGKSKPAAALTPLTSIARAPKEQGGHQRVVSAGELDDDRPQTSVGPSDRMPLTGGSTRQVDEKPTDERAVPGDADIVDDKPRASSEAPTDDNAPADEPDDLAID
ncbi:MAG: hypothetical protein HYZ09_01530 [Candidatus Kerfeldbacteria bacterium]|nr:hypothetical protein [Candidatus Kerfeldbacteria bacterium]